MGHNKHQGFTLIELTLAILFVSFLILAVATVSMHVGNMYQKGLILKTTNQAGREVADAMRRDIMQSNGSIETVTSGNIIRWCLGTVSYVANKASLINADTPPSVFKAGTVPVRLARINDPSKSLCSNEGGYPMAADASAAVDLLSSTVPALAIFDMSLEPLAGSDRQSLYEMSFILGTAEKGIVDETDDGAFCRPNTDPKANANYCSVVEFKTIIRSGGGQ
jgi:type II secretory pathway pseudopilin PulG